MTRLPESSENPIAAALDLYANAAMTFNARMVEKICFKETLQLRSLQASDVCSTC